MPNRKKLPPSLKTVGIWFKRGAARATDGCLLSGLRGHCRHGKPSWLTERAFPNNRRHDGDRRQGGGTLSRPGPDKGQRRLLTRRG